MVSAFKRSFLQYKHGIKKECDSSAVKGLSGLAQKRYVQLQLESGIFLLKWIAEYLSWASADGWLFCY